jgi:hypothetical protein
MNKNFWIAMLAFTMVSGCGSNSNQVTGDPVGPESVVPPVLDSTSVIGNDLAIQWTAVDGATGYKLYYSNDADFSVDPLESGTSTYNTDTNSITIADIDKAANHYFFIQSMNGEIAGETSQKYAAFSFLSTIDDTPGVVRDHINGLQWKRCPEGQSWDVTNSVCIGFALEIEPTEALSTYSSPDSEGWTLPLYGNTSTDSNCFTVSDEGSALSNLLACKNNDELDIRSGTFNQRLTNLYYREACESYVSEFMPTFFDQVGYTAKTPSSCSGAYLCSISVSGSVGCGAGFDFHDRSVILNRTIL